MIAESVVVGSELEERLRFEAMLSDLSSGFVNVESAEVDWLIEDAQRRVCNCLGLDLSDLWQVSPSKSDVLVMTHVYRAIEGPPIPDHFDAREYAPWTLKKVLSGEVVTLPNIDDAPAEAARDLETWRYFSITSVFSFPLTAGGGEVFGVLGFFAVEDERPWPDEIIQRLQLVSQIFANALERKRSDAMLRESNERLQLAAE